MAVAHLYDTYSDLVFRTCRAILVDHHDAEDAAQEVFAKLLARKSGQAVEDPRRWLLEVTRNHCFDRLRASARRRTVPTDVEPAAACAENPEQRSVARAQLRWLLSLLPDRQREVVVRQAVLDQDLDTVAARLGVTYGAAAQLMHRARRMLATIDSTAGAAVAAAGAHLARLRTRLRELLMQGIEVGREIATRAPFNPALALPLALLAAMLGTSSHATPAAAAAGSRSDTAISAAANLRSHAAVPGGTATAIAPTVVVRARVDAPAAPAAVGPATKVVVRPLHVPSPPPQAGPLLECRQIVAYNVCPHPPSTVSMQGNQVTITLGGGPGLP
jgi:RNA polymerase sigma-70 factor (ECF subfamily)